MVRKTDIQKKWWKSKTLWANILVVIIGVLGYFQGQLEAGVAITAAGVLNVILRTITKKKIIK